MPMPVNKKLTMNLNKKFREEIMKKSLAFLMLCLFYSHFALADVPKTINYQGRLTDLNGIVVADGTYAVTISLYNVQSGGTSLWSDAYSIPTKNGYFSIVLGSNASRPLTLDFSQQYFLGIAVSPDSEMLPRQPLQSVPYALNVAAGAVRQFSGYVVLTTSTNYSPSSGVKAIEVECQGAGGGGGGATQTATTSGGGGGGGAGGYCKKFIINPISSYAVTIGTGGSGGLPGSNGQPGGVTNFDTLVANGGGGGLGTVGASTPCTVAGADGGTATGGDINIAGGAGGHSLQCALNVGVSGFGGNATLGFGGRTRASNLPGLNGVGYGSGGSGAFTASGTSNQTGGNGASGIIIISEFK
jgi:hypothetical protein